MKRIILRIAGIILLISLCSCNITITGLCSGYSKLSERYKENIVFLDVKDNLCEQKEDGKIYVITGDHLYKCIEKQDNAMVYLWGPLCSSKYCYPLSYIQSYCDSHGYILYVIAEYYDETTISAQQKNISQPLLSINDKFYKTRYCNKYRKLFLKDLIRDITPSKEILKYHRVFIFNYGKLASSSLHLEDDTDKWELITP